MQPNDTITFSLAELKKFIKVPGVDTVTFTPDEWNYFAEIRSRFDSFKANSKSSN